MGLVVPIRASLGFDLSVFSKFQFILKFFKARRTLSLVRSVSTSLSSIWRSWSGNALSTNAYPLIITSISHFSYIILLKIGCSFCEMKIRGLPHHTFHKIRELFQLEKSLSPIDRKWLYVINLNFFVWRHECPRFLLKYWLKQCFSCLTANWSKLKIRLA